MDGLLILRSEGKSGDSRFRITIRRMTITRRCPIPSLFILAFLALGGCASGSVIITGTKRDPLPADEVSILVDPPASFETIGLLSASSDSGFTEQGSVDYAISKLKKLAASLGANGVLLVSTGETNAIGRTSSGYFFADKTKIVQGKAIYIRVK